MRNLAWAFAALLLSASSCSKENDPSPDGCVPVYRLISLEFEMRSAFPVRREVKREILRNDIAGWAETSAPVDRALVFSSRFTPDEPLEACEMDFEVRLPKVDEQGAPLGTSFFKHPFTVGSACEWSERVTGEFSVSVPPRSQCEMWAEEVGCLIEADFICKLANALTGEIRTVRGVWNGIQWHYLQWNALIVGESSEIERQSFFPVPY